MNLWHDARLLNWLATGLFAATTAAVLAVAGAWLTQRPAFALRTVVIEPAPGQVLRHVSSPLLRSTVTRKVRGNFFWTPLDQVRATFESVPWVRQASVRRIWPNRLVVTIEEHRVLGLWNDGRLVNTHGEAFAANLAEAEEDGPLPEFAGPPGSEAEVVLRWRELSRWLEPLGRRPEAVTLSPRLAWTVRLDDGTTVLLGREQGVPIADRVARLVNAWPSIEQRLGRRPEILDLRYPNGFALRSATIAAREPDAAAPRAHAALRPGASSLPASRTGSP